MDDVATTWFALPGTRGHRTVDQQMTGLRPLWPMLKGKSVLDVGCAEGLIARRCLDEGASVVDAIEIRPPAVRHARSIGVSCQIADAQTWESVVDYDVVLLLSILHKLQRPDTALARYLGYCSELCVVRLPSDCWPVMRHIRSGNTPFALGEVADKCGFELSRFTEGPVDSGLPAEFTGWLTRVPA